jgi:glyoxylase-like metal-dependent hydrolase (beta-lactamase superfamily II)
MEELEKGALEGVRQVIVTHPHIDHAGPTIFPSDRTYEEVNISRFVEPDDVVEAGEVSLRVIHTPGHEASHMVLFHEPSGTLFSGDLILNSARFTRSPLALSLRDYERSLRRLLELRPKVIVPSHGDAIDNPMEHLSRCLESVKDVKRKIAEMLEDRTEATHVEIAKELFEPEDILQTIVATVSTWAYLEDLDEEGEVLLDRKEQVAQLR